MLCHASMRGLPARCSKLIWMKFLRDLRLAQRQLLSGAQQRLIDAQAGIDANHHQVERIGQAQPNVLAPLHGRDSCTQMSGAR